MMLKPKKLGTNVRQSFSKIEAATDMPNLIEVQKDSYEWFLKEGLNEVLRDVSPIVDYTGNLSIEFTDYTLDPNPRYSVEECKSRTVESVTEFGLLVGIAIAALEAVCLVAVEVRD